jgi:hypothetical protein
MTIIQLECQRARRVNVFTIRSIVPAGCSRARYLVNQRLDSATKSRVR